MSTPTLYTPAILALAVELAAFPFDETLPFTAEARSQTCGSRICMALSCDPAGGVDKVGVTLQACAIGQAATALFVKAVAGMDREQLVLARDALRSWLSGEGSRPDWPGLELLDAVPDYPGRHGAVLLAWNAAITALS